MIGRRTKADIHKKKEIISTKSQNLRTDRQMVTDLEDWIYLKPRFKMGEANEKKSNSYHKIPEMLRNWVPDSSKVGTESKTLVEGCYKKFLGPYVSSSTIHSQKHTSQTLGKEKRLNLWKCWTENEICFTSQGTAQTILKTEGFMKLYITKYKISRSIRLPRMLKNGHISIISPTIQEIKGFFTKKTK